VRQASAGGGRGRTTGADRLRARVGSAGGSGQAKIALSAILACYQSSNQLINQSIFIRIRQPEPIVTRPIHIKKHTHNIVQNLQHRQKHEKREKLSRYWNETSAAEDHTNIFQRFSQLW